MKRSLLGLTIAAVSLTGGVTSVQAQGSGAQLEQIIVTSRRVEESVQSVPLSVSAISAEALESKGIARMNDLVLQTPSVTSQPTAGRSSVVNFGIRGQRNTDVLPTADPSVIVYIADVPQMRGYGLGALGSLDVQTVEVLKGPQGTLFGRSTTGGAINITPNAPTSDLEGSLSVGFGKYDRRMVRGIFNAPITDTVAARVAVQSEKQDGVFDNKGSVGRDAYGDRDELSWRASLQFQPTDSLTSTFYTDGFETNENGPMVDASAINFAAQNAVVASTTNARGPVAGAAIRGLFDRFNADVAADGEIYSGTTNLTSAHSKITVYGIANVTTYDISDSLTLKNILGYRKIDVDDFWDLDGTTAPILNTYNLADIEQYSEELQLSGSALDERVDWITGLFWMREKGSDYSYSASFGPTPATTGTNAENTSYSVFGQGTYHLTDALNLTVGLRANHDERQVDNEIRNPAGACTVQLPGGTVAPNDNCHREEEESFSEPSYNITLDYHLDADKMVYIAHRHGYRTGGFNGRATTDVQFQPFEPETVDDLEIGFKGDLDLAGRPLRLNAALFYSDYQEVQKFVSVNNNGIVSSNVVNAASAVLQGGELEITWLPLDSVQIDAFFAYVHAEYDEWLDVNASNPADRDKSDSEFATPIRSGGVTARYTLPVSAELGEISVQANVYAQAAAALSDENNSQGGFQSGYSLWGARLDWRDVMGSALRVGLWGKNLNNTEYYTGGVNVYNTLGYYMAYPGQPRSWGVDFTYDF
jgi:iron complex outermembrane receptor protein